MFRPMLATGRAVFGALLIFLGSAAAVPAQAEAAPQGEFRLFVEDLWPHARARGVSRATFDEAFRGVSPDPKIIALTKKQSEFVRPIWEYIRGAISNERMERGRHLAAQYADTLAGVEGA